MEREGYRFIIVLLIAYLKLETQESIDSGAQQVRRCLQREWTDLVLGRDTLG